MAGGCGGWWVAGGWWLVSGGWWLVASWLVAGWIFTDFYLVLTGLRTAIFTHFEPLEFLEMRSERQFHLVGASISFSLIPVISKSINFEPV